MSKLIKFKNYFLGFSIFCFYGSIVSITSPKDLGIAPAIFYFVTFVFLLLLFLYLRKIDVKIDIEIEEESKQEEVILLSYNENVEVETEVIEEVYIHPIEKEYASIKDGISFEYFCAKILSLNDFENVSVTTASNDYGVDVLAEKDGIRYAIQCKFYSSVLGNSSVQEVSAGISYYNCHVGTVLTNSTFTRNATELAKSTNILLWDNNYLNRLIEKAKATN